MSEQAQKPNRFEPKADNPLTAPFWEATKEKKLLVQRCISTGKYQYYPRAASIHDFGGPVEWVEVEGKGKVYAISVMHRAGNPLMMDKVPYAVALIEVEEGFRMMSNVVNCPVEDIKVGMDVKLTWEELSDGRHLPLFEPA